MHSSFEPVVIDEAYLDHICSSLKDDLQTLLDNGGDDGDYDNVVSALKHIGAVADALLPEEDD